MRTGLKLWLCGLVLIVGSAAQNPPAERDADRDGIPDEREQVLLERFLPTFLISRADCDLLPAQFMAGSVKPLPVARNGAIYGQVFPRSGSETGALIEIHYYHLWARDCGLTGHPLDTEHVAVLVTGEDSQPVSAWKAIYWYAAAHEGTRCDRGAARRASKLGAEERGATIWVSRGKHASFLSPAGCDKGCGQDRCDVGIALAPAALINIGEPGAPLNGAEWASSSDWPLTKKMKTNFPEDLLAKLANTDDEIWVAGARPNWQPALSVGATPVAAMALSNDRTSAALASAEASANSALAVSARGVGRSLKRATGFVRRALPAQQQPTQSR